MLMNVVLQLLGNILWWDAGWAPAHKVVSTAITDDVRRGGGRQRATVRPQGEEGGVTGELSMPSTHDTKSILGVFTSTPCSTCVFGRVNKPKSQHFFLVQFLMCYLFDIISHGQKQWTKLLIQSGCIPRWNLGSSCSGFNNSPFCLLYSLAKQIDKNTD